MVSYRVIANVFGVVCILMLALLVKTQGELNDVRNKMMVTKPVVAAEPKKKEVRKKKEFAYDSLAIQNKNLLNIKSLKNGKWKGQIGVDKHGHAIFKDWEYGIRAASYVLKNYSKKHKVNTVEDLVHRFCTGNHEAYIRFLSDKLGVKRNQKIELTKYIPRLLKYMAMFESGNHKLPDRLFASYDILADL